MIKLMVLMNDKIDNIEYERVAFEGRIHLIDNKIRLQRSVYWQYSEKNKRDN
jgi:hypothetical protein